ncbi:hypothetical protein SynMITS9220_02913 [Synechococcus sp. MIT S9220]|nr:hypothetical protein SynMITS9220_02913 [Synechococcus sp. MIT S9220]
MRFTSELCLRQSFFFAQPNPIRCSHPDKKKPTRRSVSIEGKGSASAGRRSNKIT